MAQGQRDIDGTGRGSVTGKEAATQRRGGGGKMQGVWMPIAENCYIVTIWNEYKHGKGKGHSRRYLSTYCIPAPPGAASGISPHFPGACWTARLTPLFRNLDLNPLRPLSFTILPLCKTILQPQSSATSILRDVNPPGPQKSNLIPPRPQSSNSNLLQPLPSATSTPHAVLCLYHDLHPRPSPPFPPPLFFSNCENWVDEFPGQCSQFKQPASAPTSGPNREVLSRFCGTHT